MKKYDRFLAKLLLFCSFIVSLYGNVEYALHELRKRLDDLHFALRESQTGLKDLPIEVVEKMLLDSIPDFRDIRQPGIARTAFLDTVKSLRNFWQTNKTYSSIFYDSTFKRLVMRRLFNGLSFDILESTPLIPMPEKISLDTSVFGNIANAFYYIHNLHNKLIYDVSIELSDREKGIKDALQQLVVTGISPNFFMDYRNLFHIAIEYDSPQIVIDMVNQGADVTIPTKPYTAGIVPASYPVIAVKYNQIPFIFAFSYSPKSAFFLLNQNLVDIKAIKERLSQAWPYYKIYNDRVEVRRQVSYYAKIVKQLVENGIDADTEVVVTIQNDMAITNSFLAFFLSYYDSYRLYDEEQEVLEVIKFLLDNKAKINKRYYMVDWAKNQTPLEFARAQKGSFPELYKLIEKYKDNPDNN